MGLPLLVLYGLGTTIGAGIFALVGKVAGHAGMLAPLAFFIASVLAAFSAFSFAELSSRMPKSAGEALYVREGLGSRHLALLVGLFVAVAGTVSAAAIAKASAGYIGLFVALPELPTIALVIVLLGLVAAWGIAESVALAAVFTLVETGALVFLVWSGGGVLGDLGERLSAASIPTEAVVWSGVVTGAFLAFYAFLGFEDMVNVAEEVKNVRRNMPLAIAVTLLLTTVIYVLVTLVAVLAMAPEELARSEAPLADLYRRTTGGDPVLISAISIFAILNGALVQIIMASRILYGLSQQGLLPTILGKVHAGRQTPLVATALIAGLVLVLALGFPIEGLAAVTSGITLAIFATVNLALWRLKRRLPAPAGVFQVPVWVPIAGCFVSLGFLALAGFRFLAS